MKKTLLFCCALLAFPFCSVRAEAPQASEDLHKTLHAATVDHKLAFILLGRPTCGNCNATKAMIRDGKIPVTAADYVLADLNIDDERTNAEFMRKFGKEQFGDTLPFVVVTDSRGKVLASSGGYKSPQQWTDLLNSAKAKASSSPTGASTGGTNSNWPFNSPAR